MKQALRHTANLPATFTGDNGSLPFEELLAALERSSASGVLLFGSSSGEVSRVLLAAGRLVSELEGLELADMIADAGAVWSFRATAGEPQGLEPVAIDRTLVAAAMALAAR